MATLGAEAGSSKLYRHHLAETTEKKHDAVRLRPYLERHTTGDEKSISAPRQLQSDIFTIHARTETVPVSAAMDPKDPTLPEGSPKARPPAVAVQEVMERHVKAKQGLREARACLLAPRGEAEQLRRREVKASKITGDYASKDSCLTEDRIAELERGSKHGQREQEPSRARTENIFDVFTEAFEQKELENREQVPHGNHWRKGRGGRGG